MPPTGCIEIQQGIKPQCKRHFGPRIATLNTACSLQDLERLFGLISDWILSASLYNISFIPVLPKVGEITRSVYGSRNNGCDWGGAKQGIGYSSYAQLLSRRKINAQRDTLPKPSCLLSRPFWTFGKPQRVHLLRPIGGLGWRHKAPRIIESVSFREYPPAGPTQFHLCHFLA